MVFREPIIHEKGGNYKQCCADRISAFCAAEADITNPAD